MASEWKRSRERERFFLKKKKKKRPIFPLASKKKTERARRRRERGAPVLFSLVTMSTSSSPPPLSLSDLHESVIARILDLSGPRAKAAASLLLPAARAAVMGNARAWSSLRFDSEKDQAGLRFADLSRMLKLANGFVEEFSLAR